MTKGPTGKPRVDAALALVEALSGRSRSTDILNRFLPAYSRDRSKDASLMHELVMGVLRRRAALNNVVSGLVRRPLAESDPAIREILLSMAYQAVFLTRIPSHARVSAAVDAARTLNGEGAARFVNAVGRSLEREISKRDVLATMKPQDLYSVPGVILARMRETLGREPVEAESEATAGAAHSTFRVNPAEASRTEVLEMLKRAGIEARETEHAALGIVADSPGVLGSSDMVPRILIPQDEASQLVVDVLKPRTGERIVDLCAGNGVKTTQILGLAPGASVLAVDRERGKLDACTRLCGDMGLVAPAIMVSDARRLPASMKGTADAVLVDAPCTGIGTMVRRPEVRYLRTPKDFAGASRVQTGILAAALDLLAPGGRLVYAVCSFALQEGPEGVKRALKGRTDLELSPTHLGPPFETTDGDAVTLPWRDGMDGFYMARIRKIR